MSSCYKRFAVVVLDSFFSFGVQKKWSLVALNRWSSYTVTIAWESAWADSALIVLDEWLSYKGGCISRFDCISFTLKVQMVQAKTNLYLSLPVYNLIFV